MSRRSAGLVAAALVCAVGRTASAQTPAPAAAPVSPSAQAQARGAGVITPALVARYRDALAADSLRVRAVPGPALERAARYVAEQFQALGLTPRSGRDWIQPVPVPRRHAFDGTTSQLVFKTVLTRHGRRVRKENNDEIRHYFYASFAAAARLLPPAAAVLPGGAEEVVVLTGQHTPASVRAAAVGGKVALYFPPADADSATRRQVLQALRARTSWVVVADDQSAAGFAAALAQTRGAEVALLDRALAASARWAGAGWTVAVRDSLLAAFVETAGLDIARARATAAPAAQPLTIGEVVLEAQPKREAGASGDRAAPTVPNVVGVLQGSDSTATRPLLVTARLDGPQGPANMAGLLALARAFRAAPPRQTITFLALSEGTEQWGSQRFTGEAAFGRWSKPVAHLALDMGGGSTGDSVRVYGASEVEGKLTPVLLAALHPELGLRVVDGGTLFEPARRAFASARAGVPSLELSAGATEPGHAERPGNAGDRPRDSFGAEPARAVRVLRLAYYLVEMLGDGAQPVRWSAMGRRALLMPGTP